MATSNSPYLIIIIITLFIKRTYHNKKTKVLIIYSVILFVISIISVTLAAEYAIDELNKIIFVITDSKLIRTDVLF